MSTEPSSSHSRQTSGSAEALLLQGVQQAERNEFAAAALSWSALIAANAPAELLTQACFNMGLMLLRLEQHADAEAYLRAALQADPANAQAACHLTLLQVDALTAQAATAEEAGELDAASQYFGEALSLLPNAPSVLTNLAVVRYEQGALAEAETLLRQARMSDPGYALAALYLSNLLLAQGRYAEGWALYEARFDASISNGQTLRPNLPFPQWQGESLVGKRLLVWPEQGLGDEIQFCRYLPCLKQMGATQLSVVCRPALLPLLATMPCIDALIASDQLDVDVAEHDYWTFSLSLPLHCQLAEIPAQLPYLHSLPERLEQWAPRLPLQPRIGLLWQGNPLHLNDAHRSLPLAALQPLWELSGLSFVSLQRERYADDPHQPMTQLATGIRDFADAAAIIAQLDLVITVDSAYAHLAGALGKPVWLLLPARQTDWRWLRGGADTHWYPGVMKIYRQTQRGDWPAVVSQIKDALVSWRETQRRTGA